MLQSRGRLLLLSVHRADHAQGYEIMLCTAVACRIAYTVGYNLWPRPPSTAILVFSLLYILPIMRRLVHLRTDAVL